jgi:hypothetical protein
MISVSYHITPSQTFMARLDNYFNRHKDAYVDEKTKVADAVAELDDGHLKKWFQQKRDVGEDLTWEHFSDFLLCLIHDLVNLAREARRKYANTRQRSEESIRDFAAFLKDLEQILPRTKTNTGYSSYERRLSTRCAWKRKNTLYFMSTFAETDNLAASTTETIPRASRRRID